MNQTVLEVQNLCKSFGVTKANQDIQLTLRAGEVHSLAGENGSGKSTLISQIVGIQKPDSGTICWKENRMRHHRHWMRMLQESGLLCRNLD